MRKRIRRRRNRATAPDFGCSSLTLNANGLLVGCNDCALRLEQKKNDNKNVSNY